MKPYEKYIPSGVEWIGDIPEGWGVKKLKYLSSLRNTKTDDADLNYIALEHIESQTGKIIKSEGDDIQPEGECLAFYKNDVLFCKLRPYLAKCIIAKTDGKCTSELLVLKSNPELEERFLYYTMLSFGFISSVNASTYGSKMPRTNWEFISKMYVPLPNNATQQTIADFLDTETARIDSIIKAKETLIERLKEKRTALITHAVTRGLDPNAKMKPSGVAWIGNIPVGWKTEKLKYVVKTKITDGPHTTPELVPDGIPFVSAEAVKNNKVNLALMRGYISTEDHKEFCQKCRPQKGDIFMIKAGATTGNVAIVDFDTTFSIWSPLALIRAKESEFEQRYVFYSMLSNLFVEQVNNSWSFGTQQNIGMGVIENLVIFAPHKEEQKLIVKTLDEKVPAIDSAISKNQLSIEKIKEYRTALISACVTGKLDVRSV